MTTKTFKEYTSEYLERKVIKNKIEKLCREIIQNNNEPELTYKSQLQIKEEVLKWSIFYNKEQKEYIKNYLKEIDPEEIELQRKIREWIYNEIENIENVNINGTFRKLLLKEIILDQVQLIYGKGINTIQYLWSESIKYNKYIYSLSRNHTKEEKKYMIYFIEKNLKEPQLPFDERDKPYLNLLKENIKNLEFLD
jgi:hypothetical protein